MEPVVLFRRISDTWEQPELDVAKKHFQVSETRIGLVNKLVIARYSTYPFYRELQNDLEIQGSKLINNFYEHFYISNFDYYNEVKDFTPKTYFNLTDVPKDEDKEFIVKGRTKSKKEDWNKLMFAKGYTNAANITCELMKDTYINKQGIIVRDFVPLKVLEVGINDMPFSNEWRFFYYKTNRLCHFYYWKIGEKEGTIDQDGINFADMIAKKLSDHVTFFVIDIAEKAEGGWILIEANDGQSSGLDEDAYENLYGELSKYVK